MAWARALRIRVLPPGPAADALPDPVTGPVPGRDPGAPPGLDAGHRSPPPEHVGGYRAFHSAGAEMRYVAGAFATQGPAAVWVRLALPVVPGEVPTPLQRAAAAADFGNGVSSALDFARHSFINADLSVHLQRGPSANGCASTPPPLSVCPGSGWPSQRCGTPTGPWAGPCRAW